MKFDPGYTTSAMESVFSPKATVAAILEFESALAVALADVGIAPRDEAEAVARTCSAWDGDPETILASTWERGTPLLALREEVSGGPWFHHGATTQDAIDTGLMLQARSALAAIDADLASMSDRLTALRDEHADQPHMARTFLQDARPTTFGVRMLGWLNTVSAHRSQLIDEGAALAVQLGGSHGDRSAYGDQGEAVMEALARRLGLTPAPVWHTDRTRILALVQALQRLSASMAKIATDVTLLASSAIEEVSVRSGGSSSMPEKQNPIDAVRAIAAASACNGAVAMITSAPPAELDRGVGGWHVEWFAVPLVFRTSAASVEAMRVCLESLEVDRDRMSENVS